MWHKALKVTSIALLTLILLGSQHVTAQGGSSGIVQGQVVNWTLGGSSVNQVEVTLNIYQLDNQLTPAVGTTDGEGRFEFTGLVTDTDYVYQLELVYQGAEYLFEAFGFAEGETVKTPTLAVYDSTPSDQAIRVDRSHIIVNVEPGILNVTEYYLFANDANTTYIGSNEVAPGARETLRFSLSPGATALSWGGELMECCTFMTEYGFTDTMIFLPGTKEILFSYQLGYESESYSLPLRLYYPVKSLDLMLQGENIAVHSNLLIQGEPLEMEGAIVNRYTARDLERDSTVDILFSGLSEAGESQGLAWQFVVPVALAHILVIGFVVWLRRRRRASLAVEPAGGGDIPDKEELLREIALLDDDFERGDISEEDYIRQRTQMKARLIEIMRREKIQADE